MKNRFEIRTLNELLDSLESGGRPQGGGTTSGDIPSVGGEHLNNIGSFDFSSMKFIPRDYYQSMNQGKIRSEDILVVKDGATTGKTAFVDNTFPFREAAVNEHVFIVRTNSNKLDSRYAFFFLHSDNGKRLILKDFRGSAQGGITRGFIERIKIPLPPLPIQKQIADILEKADAAREKRRQANKLTEQFLQSAFLEMFGDPVTNPKGWETLKGEELFTYSSGKFNPVKNLDDNFPYPTYGGNGVTGYSDKYLVDSDTLVIGRVGVYCGSIHRTNGRVWITDNAIYVKKFNRKIDLDFAYFLFRNLKFNRFANYSGQPKITQAPLEESFFIFPPSSVQQKFATLVEKVESLPASGGSMRQAGLRARQRESEKELENLFNALMQKAFKGELVQ